MTSHRKPTAGFWITVALIAVLAYPIDAKTPKRSTAN
jgi:hypothetical protein